MYHITSECADRSSSRVNHELTRATDLDMFSQKMFELTNLQNGQDYLVSVKASNAAGFSLETTETFRVGIEPEAPTNVETDRSADAENAIVKWDRA